MTFIALLFFALQDPVATEPALPDLADPKDKAFQPLHGGGYIHFTKNDAGKLRFHAVVLPAEVVLQDGLIEVFICGEGGKDYESAVRTTCDLQQLDMALAISGLKKGKLPAKLGDPLDGPQAAGGGQQAAGGGQGSRTIVLVQWADENKKTVTMRAEDLVRDVAKDAPMPRVGWTYVGAWEEERDPLSGKATGQKILAASRSKSICTTFHDPSALLDNPLPKEGRDDTVYHANVKALPPPGTRLRLIIRAPTAAELDDIRKLEEKLAKND